MVNVRAQSFERTMNDEATKPFSVTAHGQVRERKELSAPGEVPSKALSDAGPTPAGSTKFSCPKRYPAEKPQDIGLFRGF